MSFNTHELAWAAGFFDGEGSTSTSFQYGRMVLRLSISQVDRRVLDRFATSVGMGRISLRKTANPRHRDAFALSLATHEQVQACVALMWKWLSPVKREQAASALKRYCDFRRANPPKTGSRYGQFPPVQPKTCCKRGHEYTPENKYVNAKRGSYACRVCARDRARERKAS